LIVSRQLPPVPWLQDVGGDGDQQQRHHLLDVDAEIESWLTLTAPQTSASTAGSDASGLISTLLRVAPPHATSRRCGARPTPM
jgi:hypothetical protein